MAKLTIDNWDGVHNRDVSYSIASLEECIKYVLDLDGKKHTLLTISNGDSLLMVGGGKEKFIVTRQDGAGNSFSLIGSPQAEEGSVELCAGGQYGNYDAKLIADIRTAERAIKEFVSNKKDDGLLWSED